MCITFTRHLHKRGIIFAMNETMGQRLKRLRSERNLNQADVYAATNIDRSHLSKLENDKAGVSWECLASLADFYGVSIDFLRGKTPVASIQSPDDVAHSDEERLLLRIWRGMNENEQSGLIALIGGRLNKGAM